MPTDLDLEPVRKQLLLQKSRLGGHEDREKTMVYRACENRPGPRELAEIARIRTKYTDWEAGYKMLTLVGKHAKDSRYWRNTGSTVPGAVSQVEVGLSPSIAEHCDSFCDHFFTPPSEILPAFTRALMRWSTFDEIIEELATNNADVWFLRLLRDDKFLTKASWEAGTDPEPTFPYKMPQASQRRWRLLHAAVLALSPFSPDAGNFPENVQQALRAFGPPSASTHTLTIRGGPPGGPNQRSSQFSPSLRKASYPRVLRFSQHF